MTSSEARCHFLFTNQKVLKLVSIKIYFNQSQSWSNISFMVSVLLQQYLSFPRSILPNPRVKNNLTLLYRLRYNLKSGQPIPPTISTYKIPYLR